MKNFNFINKFPLLSPWPIMFSINIFLLIIQLLLFILMINNKMNIYLLFTNIILIIYMWMNNINLENWIICLNNSIIIISMKLTIFLIIISEFMFFFTFFYINYSLFFFMSFNFNYKFNLKMFKLNFLLALLNLIILLSSSLTFSIFTYMNHINLNHKINLILMTLTLSMYFILIQLFEYKMLNFNISNSIYFSNFFMLTLFHMNHVIIGTLMMIYFYYSMNKLFLNKMKIKLLCWYWHFIDFIWILIITLIYYFINMYM